MKTLIEKVKTAAKNHSRFVKTREEIAHMPLDVALDLGIFRGDASRIAYQTVYGAKA